MPFALIRMVFPSRCIVQSNSTIAEFDWTGRDYMRATLCTCVAPASSRDDRNLVHALGGIPRETHPVEMRVAASACEKFGMAAGFHDRASFDHVDHIGLGDGMQPVGNDQGGAAP